MMAPSESATVEATTGDPVQHGTAFDIAGKGIAGEKSLLYAMYPAAGHKIPG